MKKLSKSTKRTILIASATAVVFTYIGTLLPFGHFDQMTASADMTYNTMVNSKMYASSAKGSSMSNRLTVSEFADGMDMGAESGYADSANSQESVLQGRKIIRSANLTIESKTFDSSVEILKSAVNSVGGYMENSYINASSPRNASYTIRLPADKLDAFLENTSAIGTIVNCSTSDKEITEQYYDTEARLKTLRTQEQRLLAILEKADTLSDVIALESELSDVLYEIESLTGTLKKYDSLIAYSTVTIYLNEVMSESIVHTVPKTLGERIGQTFAESLNDVKLFLEDVAVALVGGLPIILLYIVNIAVIFAVVFVIARISLKIYRKNHPELPEAAGEKQDAAGAALDKTDGTDKEE